MSNRMIGPNSGQNRVAVFGSWRSQDAQLRNERQQDADRHWQHGLSKEAFDRACFDIGHALAVTDTMILVASDSPSTTDFQVARGAMSISTTARPCIEVVRSKAPRSSTSVGNSLNIYESEMRDTPRMFGE